MNFLEDIPVDVLVDITAWLEVIDIVRLQQCSRALQRGCNTRTIWLNAYRNMLQEHRLIQGLSLDDFSTLDLKHVVLSPVTFHNKLGQRRAPAFKFLRPERISILTPATLESFQFIELVPGGRFLLAFTQNSLQLWNLGKTARDYPPNQPVAQLMLNEGGDDSQFEIMMRPLIANRGNTLIVVCVTTYFPDYHNREVAKIHCFACSLDSGKIIRQGVLRLNDNQLDSVSWKFAYLTDEFLSFSLGRNKFIWSFQDGKSTTLIGSDEYFLSSHLAIPWIDKRQNKLYLICVSSGNARVFKLPELADPGLNVQVLAASSLVSPTPDVPGYFFVCAGRKPLSSHNDRGITSFELFAPIVGNEDEVKMRILRFTIKTSTMQSEDDLFSVMPVCTDILEDVIITPPRRPNRLDGLTYHEFPGNSRVMFWRDLGTLYCQLTRATENEPIKLWEWCGGFDSEPVFSVCPLSGRVCVLTDSEDSEPEIRVMDFVPLIG